MKIAVSIRDSESGATVEQRFGRTPQILIRDEESGEEQILDNPFADGAGGVGPKVVQLLVNNDVKAVITGQVGGNALAALRDSGITIYTCEQGVPVEDALGKYRAGTLPSIQ
ncbi:NifB/NifX family molybdenum-iron cluster-binding protein [Methanovulcanius yangii]|uniref:NifB/NifX family molybdenum-iron cluster-binding protein n=1 Tax=Methanovulcanius yangii TaxID=1789227 RepID=UPI0029CA77F2|nr:NifB/NifX family molybdenum-iron cluster-binding protein [Methanovulcanius yangii]